MKIKSIKKLVSIAIGSMVLGACSGETVHDVEWYLENPEARMAMLESCTDNTGQLQESPNCQNAYQAGLEESRGSVPTFDF